MILLLAWKNVLYRPLNALLSWLLLTAGVGIIAVVLILKTQFQQQIDANLAGVDMVLGAKGSPMQLILSAVYQVDSPTGNINYSEARRWMKHPFVEQAIPLSYGDAVKGYRIVGTTPEYLDKFNGKFQDGAVFSADFEVVVGAFAAKKLNLKTGDTFFSTHGLADGGSAHETHPYRVTGILQSSGTVLDNLIICNLESVWAMHAEENEQGEHLELPDSLKQITAALISFKSKMGFVQWPRLIAENSDMQVASPLIETNRLFAVFGMGIQGAVYAAVGIALLAALSIFIALFTSLKTRVFELALMRTLGGTRWQMSALILLESVWLCILGFCSGILLSRAGIWGIAKMAEEDYRFYIRIPAFDYQQEGLLFLVTITIGILAALLPAVMAYRLNIPATLEER